MEVEGVLDTGVGGGSLRIGGGTDLKGGTEEEETKPNSSEPK